MALQNSPSSCVVAFFQDLDILVYVFAPEKTLRLAVRIFCLAIVAFVSLTAAIFFNVVILGHILNHAYSWD